MAAGRAGTARHREKEPIDLRDLTHVIEARSAAIAGRSSTMPRFLVTANSPEQVVKLEPEP